MPPQRPSDERGRVSSQNLGSALDGEKLAHQLSDFARRLEAEPREGLMLDEIVRASVELIPGADEASISIVCGRREVTSQHASSELPGKVDALQSMLGQGPCLDAAYLHQTVRVTDMAREGRWPEFAPRAAALGAASMISFQLFVERDNLGALSLLSRTAGSFDDESESIGLLFASHAAVAFADAEKERQLNVAITSRDLIGQAKGILMERFRITAEQAFAVLVLVSQENNVKLHTVAEELAATGFLRRRPEQRTQEHGHADHRRGAVVATGKVVPRASADPADPPTDPSQPANPA